MITKIDVVLLPPRLPKAITSQPKAITTQPKAITRGPAAPTDTEVHHDH